MLCHKGKIEIIVVENGVELTYKIIPAYPFTYFDLYCPICSKKITSYKLTENDSIRCSLEKTKCKHYIGIVEKKNGKYMKETFKHLQLDYKIEREDLLIMTTAGWKKVITYTPPVMPLNSHWGASGGEGYNDVFLFLDSNGIDPLKT